MIRINLLPADKRRPERTPRPRFLLIVSNVVVLCLLAIYLAAFFVISLPQIKREIRAKTQELNELKPDIQKHSMLTAKKKKLSSKIQQIHQITYRNVELVRGLEGIWNTVHKNPRIWLEEIEYLDDKAIQTVFRKIDPKGKNYPDYAFQLECHAAGDRATAITAFRRGLREEPYLTERFTVMNSNPEYQVDEEGGFVEPYSMSFSVLIYPNVQGSSAKKPTGKKQS